MKTLTLKFILLLTLGLVASCSLFRARRGPQAEVTTLDSASMAQILEAIRSNRQQTETEDQSWQPYAPSATKVWDLVHTKLIVSFDYAKAQLHGEAFLELKPHAYAQDSLVLDARGMEIKEISDGDSRGIKVLEHRYDGKKLTIYLSYRVNPDEHKRIYIRYVAKPNEIDVSGSAAIRADKGLYFINNDGSDPDKPRQVWTQGETESNSCWFPTLDKPNQRMTQEIQITLRDSNDITLSNGIFKGRKKNTDSTFTDTWIQNIPAAPYLTMMTVGRFYVEHDRWRNKAVDYYVEPEYKPYAKLIFGKTPAMIEFFSKLLQVYFPWEKYSQVVVRDFVSGSMENASATLHGEFLQLDSREYLDNNREEYISHELFHQWFGNLVTCESWSNLPLNESFATYGEYLWLEHSQGLMSADQHRLADKLAYFNEALFRQVPLIRYHYDDKEDMFDSHSYQKGGCVLHMLRKYLGDTVFFKGLNIYLVRNKFKSVEIHDLRLAMEEVSGQDLNWFFNQWFMEGGHPSVGVGRNYDPDAKIQNLTIDFVAKDGSNSKVYRLPVDVDFYFKDSVRREHLVLDKQRNTFNFPFNDQPLLINVDPGQNVLWEIDYHKTKEEWTYQALHAPHFIDINEAMNALAEDPEVGLDEKYILIERCINDSFYAIQIKGMEMMEFMKAEDLERYYPGISYMIAVEKNTSLKIYLLEILEKLKATHDILPALRACGNDSSYRVVARVIDMLADKDAGTTMQICRSNETARNATMVDAIAYFYSNDTLNDHSAYFIRAMKLAVGYEKFSRLRWVESYLRRTNVDYAYETIKGLVPVKARIMEEPTDPFMPDIRNHYMTQRYLLADEMSRTTYDEAGYKAVNHRLATYDAIIALLE
jgi:aminopeptidase N